MGVLNIPYLEAGNSLTARCPHSQPQAWIMVVHLSLWLPCFLIHINLPATKVLTSNIEVINLSNRYFYAHDWQHVIS